MSETKGRTVIVTGAGGGVGRGMALALGKAGANVVVAARRAETGDAVAAEIVAAGGIAICIEMDVSDQASVQAMVDATVARFGGLDVMVHNALSRRAAEGIPLADIDEGQFDAVVSVASRGAFYCIKAALPHLKPGIGSVVLLLAHGGVRGHGTLPMYGIAKGIQRGLLKSLIWELGERRITVNAITPVALSEGMIAYRDTYPEAFRQQAERAPLCYIGEAEEDVGSSAVFFASTASHYITGQTLFVDGGVYYL
ncbi:SDR family oxidoreductase [soil metagenome]